VGVIRTPEDVADVVRFLVSDRAGYAVVPPAVSSSGERGGASMELIEHVTEERLRREEAAARPRSLADELSRHNEIAFVREGVRYRVDVPDEVTLTLEVEVGDEGSEIEVELSW
jgi:amphi-Trp domain-containing protein